MAVAPSTVATMFPSLVLAAASSCLMLSVPDERAYCLAKQNQRASDCAAIVDMNLRVRCRVELGQDRSQCVTITDPAGRALCQANARR